MSLLIAYPSNKLVNIADGKFQGAFAEFANKKIYLPYNSTLIDFNQLKCSIADMLWNHVDFIFPLSTLPELPPNITTGAVHNHLKCYFVGKNFIRNTIQQHEIQDTLEQIDLPTLILFGWCFILLSICLIFLNISDTMRGFWIMITVLLGNSSDLIMKQNSQRIIILSIILFAFLSQIIFGCLVRTDRFSRPEGIKVETYGDIMENNLTWSLLAGTKCETLFHNTVHGKTREKLEKYLHPGEPYELSEWINKHPEFILQIEEYLGVSTVELACIQDEFTDGRLMVSPSPVAKSPESQYMSKNLGKKKRRQLVKWGYANLEMGFNHREREFYVGTIQYSMRAKASPRCTTVSKPNIGAASLELEFFSGILNLYILVCCLATLILIWRKTWHLIGTSFPTSPR